MAHENAAPGIPLHAFPSEGPTHTVSLTPPVDGGANRREVRRLTMGASGQERVTVASISP